MPKQDEKTAGSVEDIDLRDAKGGTEPTDDTPEGARGPSGGPGVPGKDVSAPGTEGLRPATPAAPAGGPLTQMMALLEPARTHALEKAVESGAVFQIRSRTGTTTRVLYGEIVLEVPREGKPFVAAHAIHLLWTAPTLVEEIEG